MIFRNKALLLASAGIWAIASAAQAEETNAEETSATTDEIIVVGSHQTFSSNVTDMSMQEQQAPLTSVLSVVDNLPGVNVTEGDVFGFDDWSTGVSLRGFQTDLGEQQLGITIDGLPNGDSNYGGGSKANRYIDSQNLGAVEVYQGTADIASRSNEALGGTINFTTQDPIDEERVRVSASIGQNDAQRFYGRYDTGLFWGGTTKAWFSISHQSATDWINSASENVRDNFAAKIISEFNGTKLTAYFDYDDTQEDNYQRIYSQAEFEQHPDWDELTADWTGVPYVDQLYRKGWSTLRGNAFFYLKAEHKFDNGLEIKGSVYRHDNDGRGDWVPPYLVNVTDDMGGPESEVVGGTTVEGGPILGIINYVDASGNALAPMAGCVSSITFPYGGAPANFDPACYPAGAIPVQSYRHTHYQKNRTGGTLDFTWDKAFSGHDNQLRGGIWYEKTTRAEYRDWHKITDARVGYEYDYPAYYIQYNREYPQSTFKYYLEDTLTMGTVTARFGVKQSFNDVSRVDLYGATPDVSLNSNSGLLFSGGLAWQASDMLEFFGGYAKNYKALNDLILERPASSLDNLSPETAQVVEAGARMHYGPVKASLTYFHTDFDNRLIFIDSQTSTGPNYTIGTDGSFFNAGGIKSNGIEFAGTWTVSDSFSLYSSYTYNDSTYLGTGDAAVDAAVGIVPGNQVAGIPKDMFVVSADFQRHNFYGGISEKYVGERNIYADASWTAKGYHIVDLYAGVHGEAISDLFKGVDFRLTVNNLFDVDYFTTIATNSGAWLGAGRTAVFTMTVDF